MNTAKSSLQHMKKHDYPNMKFIKLDLLALLISLFLFASCENTSTIGLEIDPKSTVEGTLVDTLTITSRTLMDNESGTSALTRYPLGVLKDPIFGTTEASVVMALGLPTASYSFGTTPTLDSAVLVLNYSGEFYGDSTQVYTMNVRQLSTNFSTDESYLSNKVYPVENRIIGTKTGRLFPSTKYKVTDIVTAGKDTLKTVTPQIRIKLDNAFIQEYLVNVSSGTLVSDAIFKNYFRGFQVQVNNPTGSGAMMFLDLASTNSNLSLYFKKSNTVTTPASIDTVNAIFPLGNSLHRAAASVKHDYAGTPVETQLNNPNQQFTQTYLQPLVGLKNKITFPSLTKFSATAGKIVVNKAELVIDLVAGSDAKPFEAAPRLSLYRYDIAEQRGNLPDNSPSTDIRGFADPSIYGGYFNPVTRQYVFVITSYIQDLVSNKTKDYGTFLAPTPTNEFLFTPSLSSAARAIIGAQKKNAAAGEHTMKLNIYYTKVN